MSRSLRRFSLAAVSKTSRGFSIFMCEPSAESIHSGETRGGHHLHHDADCSDLSNDEVSTFKWEFPKIGDANNSTPSIVGSLLDKDPKIRIFRKLPIWCRHVQAWDLSVASYTRFLSSTLLCPFYFRAPCWEQNSKKKGTLFVTELLRNLVSATPCLNS